MTLSRQQAVHTYSSSSGGQSYLFDIVVDAQGLISVKNIRSSTGALDCSSSIPSSVLSDIEIAKGIVQQQLGETQVDSGNIVFDGQTEQTVLIAAGVLNNTNYRVVYTTPDGIPLTTESKTTTSFKAVAPCTYGTPADPKTVGYVVLVATQQASVTSGAVTFTDADGGTKNVTFSPAFDTNAYRVVLSPDGFFTARVINQTKTGFTIQLGYTLGAGQTADVGYDVFVS